MLFAPKCLLIQHFNCLDYNPLTSIYLYLGYHYWAFLGTWSQYLYYISRYVQVVYLSTNSLLVFISKEFYVLSYPHLRILGEGPLQRATLNVSGLRAQSTSWCHYCVCGPMSLSAYYGGVIFIISWRSMAVIFWFNSWWSIRVDPCSIY